MAFEAIAFAAAEVLGGITVGEIAAAVVGTAISVGVSKLTAAKPDAASSSFDSQARGALLNVASNVAPLDLVYGFRRVGGARVFAHTTGDWNQYLHLVLALGEGEVEDIGEIYLDNVPISDARWTKPEGPYVYARRMRGADDQPALDDIVLNVGGMWTSAHRGVGVAYVYMWLHYSEELFSGLPEITADVRGLKVYDPRTGTVAWSDNPALCLRDYLTRARERGGRGIPESFIDDASIIAAANYCDEWIDSGGGVQRRYTCNARLSVDADPLDNVRAILSAFRGYTHFSGGKYRVGIFRDQAPSGFAFTEDNIVGAWQIRLPGKRDKANRVKAQYFDPTKDWQPDYAIWESAAWRAEDNGLVLERSLDLPCTTDYFIAQRLAQLECRESRYATACSFTATIAALEVELGDVVSITHSTPGWSGALFRVVDLEPLSSDEVRVVARQYDLAAYDISIAEPRSLPPATNLPDPTVVGLPGFPAVREELYETIGSAGVKARAVVEWGAAADVFVVGYEVQYRREEEALWSEIQAATATRGQIDDIAPGDYRFRVRSRNALGFASAWQESRATIAGLTAPPAALTGFSLVPHTGLALLSWDTPADLDVRVGGAIAVRHSPATSGATWEDAVPIGNALGRFPGSATSALAPLLSGTYLAKTIDSGGRAAWTAAAVVTTAPDVLSWNAVATVTEHAAFSGTKTNLEVASSKLRLGSLPDVDSIGDNLDAWVDFDSAGRSDATSGTYAFANRIDFGAVYPARLTADVRQHAFDTGDLWDARGALLEDWQSLDGSVIDDAFCWLEMRTTADNPAGTPTWSDWKPFSVADYSARAFEFRLRFQSASTNHNVEVDTLTVSADMVDRVEAGNVTTGTGADTTVTFGTAFYAAPKVGLTMGNAATGDYLTIASEATGSFAFSAYNAGGTRVARSVNWIAKGY
jgi:hypothetical protein